MNCILEYLKVKKESNIIPDLPVTVLCQVQLLYFSPCEDTLTFEILKNGSIKFYAYYEDQWNTEDVDFGAEEMVITKEELIPVLQYLKNLYDGKKLPLEKCVENNQKYYEPAIKFQFEDFSYMDSETKMFFKELCKFLKIRFPKLKIQNNFLIHLTCRKLAQILLSFFIFHNEYVFENKCGFDGYYRTLFDLKKKLIQQKLIACKDLKPTLFFADLQIINNGIRDKKILISKELITRLETEEEALRKNDLLYEVLKLNTEMSMRPVLMSAYEISRRPVFGNVRGAAACSMLAYLSGITAFNPLELGIDFDIELFKSHGLGVIDIDSETYPYKLKDRLFCKSNFDEMEPVKLNPLDALFIQKSILVRLNKQRSLLHEISLTDKEILSLFKKADVSDITGFENEQIRQLLTEHKLRGFIDVARIYALYYYPELDFDKPSSEGILTKIDALSYTLNAWREAYFKAYYPDDFTEVKKKGASEPEPQKAMLAFF